MHVLQEHLLSAGYRVSSGEIEMLSLFSKGPNRAIGVVVVFIESFDGICVRTVGFLHDPVDGLRVKICFIDWLSDFFYNVLLSADLLLSISIVLLMRCLDVLSIVLMS